MCYRFLFKAELLDSELELFLIAKVNSSPWLPKLPKLCRVSGKTLLRVAAREILCCLRASVSESGQVKKGTDIGDAQSIRLHPLR
jgi:hypothetical protein